MNLLVLFLFVIYIALVYWTYQDAKKRIEDPVLIACATAASLFPFAGTVIYTVLRPPEFLEDVRERELEIRASELRLRELIERSCPHCEYPIERNFISCPNCGRGLKTPCRSCSKPLDPKWRACPYCETEVQRRKQPDEQQQTRRSSRTQRPRRQRKAATAAAAPAPAQKAAAQPKKRKASDGSKTRRSTRSTEAAPSRSRTQS